MTRKYCKDCIKFQPSTAGDQYGRCGDDRATQIPGAEKYISAELDKSEQKYVTTVRTTESLCGVEAAWFQPKDAA